MRLNRIWAIARRDWRTELKGPQGAWLPIVMAALLVPSSAAPLPRQIVATEASVMTVSGDVPPEVVALRDTVRPVRRGQLHFDQRGDVLYTRGEDPPMKVREILDRYDGVEVSLERFDPGYVFPGRSMLFALISASTLTGAISASIGGERSNHTLVSLMAAAVSRLEIVLGKLVAWGGLGAFTSLGAAILAIVLGSLQAGAWLLPMPFVPIATAALGLWLVRRATDVIAASTTLIRVLPVLLVTTGLFAWLLGNTHPLLGAVVPIGGALIASGDTWAGVMAPFVATLSAVAFTAFCVVGTARELESPSTETPLVQQGLGLGALVASTWWLPVLTPLLWAEAGNFKVTQQIPVEAGIFAGALSFLLFVMVAMGRSGRPLYDVGLAGPLVTPRRIALGLLATPFVVLATWNAGVWLVAPEAGFLRTAAERLATNAFPVTPFALAALLIVSEELLFRGWLARRLTPIGAGAVYVLVKAPFDPLGGVTMATILGAVGASTGPLGSMAARLGALGLLWLLSG
ncbi:MAG: hypothetical protein AAGA48_07275 [Myxococcota bacterium]